MITEEEAFRKEHPGAGLITDPSGNVLGYRLSGGQLVTRPDPIEVPWTDSNYTAALTQQTTMQAAADAVAYKVARQTDWSTKKDPTIGFIWTHEAQLEARLEAEMGDSTKLEALKAFRTQTIVDWPAPA